ncbi:MAG: 2Fe-2S iron-sulfur cluster binding domain-containing protein [Erythrobacter sp.]|nr:MAG: 2Fe-2S iron-sulfur cluster binding domain-containing protein [Erythrobacter sp.]
MARQSQYPPRGAGRCPPDVRLPQCHVLRRERLRQRVGPTEPCADRHRARRARGEKLDPARLRALHAHGRHRTGGRRDRRCRRRAVAVSIKVKFIAPDGRVVEAEAEPGDSLLRVGQAAGLPLEGTCEGQMACSTCHVVVAPEWFERLSEASEEEEDMLDFAAGVRRTSRLSCQIELTEAMDGLTVTVPGESVDARRM